MVGILSVSDMYIFLCNIFFNNKCYLDKNLSFLNFSTLVVTQAQSMNILLSNFVLINITLILFLVYQVMINFKTKQ